MYHSCLGVPNGVLLFGGRYDSGRSSGIYNKDVFLLRNSTWKIVGKLKRVLVYGSSIQIGSSIFVVNGNEGWHELAQRLEWDGNRITSVSEIGGRSSAMVLRPTIFPVNQNYCL